MNVPVQLEWTYHWLWRLRTQPSGCSFVANHFDQKHARVPRLLKPESSLWVFCQSVASQEGEQSGWIFEVFPRKGRAYHPAEIYTSLSSSLRLVPSALLDVCFFVPLFGCRNRATESLDQTLEYSGPRRVLGCLDVVPAVSKRGDRPEPLALAGWPGLLSGKGV